MTTDRTHRSLRSLSAPALAAGLLLFWLALPAHAMEDRRPLGSKPRSDVRVGARHAAESLDSAVGPLERLRRRLQAIPLRPVSIGTPPRRPTDPERGLGVVIRIPF